MRPRNWPSFEEVATSWPSYDIADSARYEDALEEGKSEEEALREGLDAISAQCFFSEDYFYDGSDMHFAYARDALALPDWAETYGYEDGGPGSGLYAHCIAIRPPYTLTDLVEWLKEREARAKTKSGSRT